jgi:hypothetical protein
MGAKGNFMGCKTGMAALNRTSLRLCTVWTPLEMQAGF